MKKYNLYTLFILTAAIAAGVAYNVHLTNRQHRISTAAAMVAQLPASSGRAFDPTTVIRVVNAFYALGERDCILALRQFAQANPCDGSSDGQNEKLGLLIPFLFMPRNPEDLYPITNYDDNLELSRDSWKGINFVAASNGIPFHYVCHFSVVAQSLATSVILERCAAKEPMLTIALDLDETLLCVTKEPLPTPAHAICSHGYIYLRPYASDFLKCISKSNRVGIWSSAPSEYVTSVLSESKLQDVDFKFLWTTRECSFNDYGTGTLFYYKDTNNLRQAFNTDLVLLIDDSPAKIVSHGSDAIAIESFSGDDNDDELLHVSHFVEAIQNADHKVTFDKFGWRNVKR